MESTVNQIIESFTFLKTAKRGKKMQKMEEILHSVQNDKRLPCFAPTLSVGITLTFGEATRNDGNRVSDCSVKRDPKGHAINWNRFFTTFRMTKRLPRCARNDG